MSTTPKSELTITLSSDTPYYAHIKSKEGLSSSEKTVSFDALTSVLGAHAKRSTPLLPNNLLRMKDDKKTTRYMVQTPAKKRNVIYKINGTDHHYEIMTPTLVYIAHVENIAGAERVKFHEGQLFATNTPVLTGLERTYHAPFGNIWKNASCYNSDKICWGENASLGTTLKMSDLHVDRFFLAAFNTDLDTGRFEEHSIEDFKLFKTNHLYAQMDKMFKEGATEQQVLDYLHQHMSPQADGETVNTYFERI